MGKTTEEQHNKKLGIGPRPECFKSTAAEILFVASATMAGAMTASLTGGLTVVTAKIGRDLNMSNAEVSWAVAASSLSAGSFLLFFGRIADLFGRKLLMVVSMLLFAVFSLASGFAKDGITFDILQGMMGLFSASAVPAAIGTLGSVYQYPSRRKNYAFACFSAGNPLGFVFGSVACGIATTALSWRAFMWFLAIVYVLFAGVSLICMPTDTDEKQPLNWTTLKNFDLVGTVLTTAGFGLLSAALTLAGDAPEGWRTPYVIALLVIGIVLIVVFIWWETLASQPLVPMWVWKDRDFSLLLLIMFMGNGSFGTASFWINLYIQRFWTSSSILVAVYILPMAIMGTLVNVFAGLLLHRVSNKLLMALGAAAFAVSFLLLSLNKTSDGYWPFVFPAFIICVWGADLEFNVATMYVMTSLSRAQQSTGGGIFQTVARLSQVIVIGISTAIFNAIQSNPPTSGYHANDPIAPYSGTFYFSTALCFASLLFCPLLRVGTQGNIKQDDKSAGSISRTETPDVTEAEVPPLSMGVAGAEGLMLSSKPSALLDVEKDGQKPASQVHINLSEKSKSIEG